MKIIVTGASGFVGQQLIPKFRAAGHDLLLMGRSPERLSSLFPIEDSASYEELAEKGRDYDLLIHLAVQNNDSDAQNAVFEATNLDLFKRVLEAAATASIPTVLNFSSFHTLDDANHSPYATSKRQALAIKGADYGLTVVNLLLPAVYADRFAGRLARLNSLPGPLRRGVFACLSALSPVVHIDRVCRFILDDLAEAQDGQKILLADPKSENLVFRALKRGLDLLIAMAILVGFWWLLLIVWILVKTTSTGPGIFAQDRVGKHARTFTCYKFRTMAEGTQQVGTHEISAASVTRIGGFLRKTKIDELPQIWNMIIGNISFVGPRPCLPSQQALIDARAREGVFAVLPGITGLSQIRNVDMSVPERLSKSDAEYIARQSVLLDLKIIVKTFLGSGQGDKVKS